MGDTIRTMLISVLTLVVIGLVTAHPTLGATRPLQIKITVDREQAYVNEQILVIREVRYDPQVFNVTGPSLKVTGADVITVNAETIKKKKVTIARTVYGLFAREPGVVQISPLKFLGNLPAGSRQNSRALGARSSGRNLPQVKAVSRAHSVRIERAPDNNRRNWLSAANITLTSQWHDLGGSRWHVGQPRTRVVTIRSFNQQAAAIVPIPSEAPSGLRLYPEPARLNDQKTPHGVVGSRVQSTVVMPSRAGELTLPALRIDWFNTGTRQWQQSELPAETVSVLADPASAHTQWRVLILAGVCLVLAAACCLLVLSNRRLRQHLHIGSAQLIPHPSEAQAWRSLKRTLKRHGQAGDEQSGDPAQVRQQILNWAQARWPAESIRTLEQVSAKAGEQSVAREALVDLMHKLNQTLFSADPDGEPPEPNLLLRELTALRQQARRRSGPIHTGSLSAMYTKKS